MFNLSAKESEGKRTGDDQDVGRGGVMVQVRYRVTGEAGKVRNVCGPKNRKYIQ